MLPSDGLNTAITRGAANCLKNSPSSLFRPNTSGRPAVYGPQAATPEQ